MEDCLFCRIQGGLVPITGGVIYEDDLTCATHYTYDAPDDEKPSYLGHLTVQTRRHAKTFADLTAEEAQATGLLITRLAKALEVCAGAERSYIEFFGEVVPHLHVLMTARYPNTPPEYWRTAIYDWPDAPRGNHAAVATLCDKLRAYLKTSA